MYNQLITESMCIKIIPNHHNLAVSCLYISYMLFIFEYKIRVSSLIVLTSLCLNWCLNQRKIGRVRYKKICLYVAVNQFLMQHWRCTWKNVAHLLWEQRVAGSNPVTPTENETVTKVAVFLLSWFLGGFEQMFKLGFKPEI